MVDGAKKHQRIPVYRPAGIDDDPEESVVHAVEQPEEPAAPVAAMTPAEETVDWRDMALRLRADMDNFRRRQQRMAEEQIVAEKKRLLLSFLEVLDNLDRIIRHLDPADPYHQSIRATYDDMLKLLRLEGVEPIPTVNVPFDPLLHDAVGVVSARDGQKEDMVIVAEERKGYRLGDQVLRPARVMVAKR
ncbi:MAG TPA: nucleotide exchange factor GrpE [Anaerolineae bacterium]|nr:nucleotide exchange factor GrpE [Anaerolineae bacterium]HQH38345.1 nucleotide exchange factor GrpE [Anaerolineae bacterium]